MAGKAFELAFDSPIDFAATLEIFRRSGDDLLDRWDGSALVRTVRLEGKPLAFAAKVVSTAPPKLWIQLEHENLGVELGHHLAQSLPSLPVEFHALCQTDPTIGRLSEIHRGFRPVLHRDLFVALIRCISAQQVNLRWAATVRRRLAETYGDRHEVGEHFVYSLNPERLAALNVADIRALQFTTRKAEYVTSVARAIADGTLDRDALDHMADTEVIERITAVRGLGIWSAEWVLARTLGRPRVSIYDLGVRKAIGKAYYNGRMPLPHEVRDATAHWGAAAGFAQELLLHAQHLKTL
jgi:DNA-3-methyladenine glycosylase II